MSYAAFSEGDLYAPLSPELRMLALRGVVRNYPKKSVIINEGDIGDSLFVLLKGSVKMFSGGHSGREITFERIYSGDYFGEMSIDGSSRCASIMTLEPTICAVLSRANVREHLAQEPEFVMSLVHRVIGRARQAIDLARKMALLDVYGRLLALLEGHDGSAPGLIAVNGRLACLTHQDIAGFVGASREMVSRLLKDLEKGGYISMATKRITVLKKLPSRW
jgi:CRP/FNR family cyclic AMP-dependent transcriptional regulator